MTEENMRQRRKNATIKEQKGHNTIIIY